MAGIVAAETGQRRGRRWRRLRRRLGHARHRPRCRRHRPGQRHHRGRRLGRRSRRRRHPHGLQRNPGYSSALQAAVDYAWSNGVVLVAAAGNDGSSTATFPAGDRGVIGVSNTDSSDALAGSSNYGAAVFLGAPGRRHPDAPRTAATRRSHGHVGLGGACRGRGRVAARGGSVRLERRHRRPAGPQRGRGRNGRRDRQWSAECGPGPRRYVHRRSHARGAWGSGGPIVGPYIAANKNLTITFAGTGTGTRDYHARPRPGPSRSSEQPRSNTLWWYHHELGIPNDHEADFRQSCLHGDVVR